MFVFPENAFFYLLINIICYVSLISGPINAVHCTFKVSFHECCTSCDLKAPQVCRISLRFETDAILLGYLCPGVERLRGEHMFKPSS